MRRERGRSSRRQWLKACGVLGGAAVWDTAAGAEPPPTGPAASFRGELQQRIEQTPFVNTHEHLPDEEERLNAKINACDDWAVLCGHYLDSDLVVAGMPAESRGRFLSRGLDPVAKWRLIAPYWSAVKNTGYGQAARIAIRELYGVDEMEEKTIPRIQQGYEAVRKPGFYRKILVDLARIQSCQVNYLGGRPFKESRQPTLLTQDLSIVGMHMGPDLKTFGGPTGIAVRDLSDWHAVIRWWFEKYGPYAMAVKSQAAYSRGLDYEQVPAEKAEPVFAKVLRKEAVSEAEQKLLQDHLFWYAVQQATRHGLPVKLHTGYYAGSGGMPLGASSGTRRRPANCAAKRRKRPSSSCTSPIPAGRR